MSNQFNAVAVTNEYAGRIFVTKPNRSGVQFRYRFNGSRWVDLPSGIFYFDVDHDGWPLVWGTTNRVPGTFEEAATPVVAVTENRIIKAEVVYIKPESAEGYYVAQITKEFAPEYGGGTQVFTAPEGRYSIHIAIDDLLGMVTVSPGRRTDAEVSVNV